MNTVRGVVARAQDKTLARTRRPAVADEAAARHLERGHDVAVRAETHFRGRGREGERTALDVKVEAERHPRLRRVVRERDAVARLHAERRAGEGERALQRRALERIRRRRPVGEDERAARALEADEGVGVDVEVAKRDVRAERDALAVADGEEPCSRRAARERCRRTRRDTRRVRREFPVERT